MRGTRAISRGERTMNKIVAACGLLLAVGTASAANYQGLVSHGTPLNGHGFLAANPGGFDGAASTCFTSATTMVYSFDPSTAIGKAILAAALSAKLTNKQV